MFCKNTVFSLRMDPLDGFSSMKREFLKNFCKSTVFSSRMDPLDGFSSMKRDFLKNFCESNGGDSLLESIFVEELMSLL